MASDFTVTDSSAVVSEETIAIQIKCEVIEMTVEEEKLVTDTEAITSLTEDNRPPSPPTHLDKKPLNPYESLVKPLRVCLRKLPDVYTKAKPPSHHTKLTKHWESKLKECSVVLKDLRLLSLNEAICIAKQNGLRKDIITKLLTPAAAEAETAAVNVAETAAVNVAETAVETETVNVAETAVETETAAVNVTEDVNVAEAVAETAAVNVAETEDAAVAEAPVIKSEVIDAASNHDIEPATNTNYDDNFKLVWSEDDDEGDDAVKVGAIKESLEKALRTESVKNIKQDISDYADALMREAQVHCKAHRGGSSCANSDSTGKLPLADVAECNGEQSALSEDDKRRNEMVVKMEKILKSQWDGRMNCPGSGDASKAVVLGATKLEDSSVSRVEGPVKRKCMQSGLLERLSKQLFKDQQGIRSDVVLRRFPTVSLQRLDPSTINSNTVRCAKRGRKTIKREVKRQGSVCEDGGGRRQLYGPRVKHVCRGDSQVLGYPVARFKKRPSSSYVEKRAEVDADDEPKSNVKSQLKYKKRVRFNRCRKCEACRKPNCRKCVYCLDMKKYGGLGVMKQACRLRKCLNPNVPDVIRDGQAPPVMLVTDDSAAAQSSKGGHRIRKVSSTYQKILTKYFGISFSMKRKQRMSRPVRPIFRNKHATNFTTYLASLSRLKEEEIKKSVITRRVFVSKLKGSKSLIRKKSDCCSQPASDMAPKFPSPKPGCIWPYIRQDYNDEETGVEGMALVSDSPNPLRVACYLCGSAGLEELIYCALCCEPFHTFCLNLDEVPNSLNVQNWCCKLCQYCSVCGLPYNLVTCSICLGAYHPKCLGPHYPLPPSLKQKWCCLPCARCERCGTNVNLGKVNGNSSGDYLLCADCIGLSNDKPCLMCSKYIDGDMGSKVMTCSVCKRSVHCQCDGLTDDMYYIALDMKEEYVCPFCLVSQLSLVPWKFSVVAKLNLRLEEILETFLEVLPVKKNCEIRVNDGENSLKELEPSLDIKLSTNVDRTVLEEISNCALPFELGSDAVIAAVNDKDEVPTMVDICTNENESDVDPPKVTSPVNEIRELQKGSEQPTIAVIEQKQHFNLYKVKMKLKHKDYSKIINFVEDTLEVFEEKYSVANESWEELLNSLLQCVKKVLPWFEENRLDVARAESLFASTIPLNILEHNYAHPQPIDPTFKLICQPSVYRSDSCRGMDVPVHIKSPNPRVCALCRETGDEYHKYGGRMLFCGKDDWIHVNCAVWSYEVVEEKNGSLKGIYSAISRGNKSNCIHCGKLGGTVRCHAPQCQACFHFVCAVTLKVLLQEDGKVFCRDHYKLGDRSQVTDDVLFTKRRAFVDVNETFTYKKCWKTDMDPSCISLLCGSLTVGSLGEVCNASCFGSTLIPANFCCSRVYWSTKHPQKRVVYRCQTVLLFPEVEEPNASSSEQNVTIAHESGTVLMKQSGNIDSVCEDGIDQPSNSEQTQTDLETTESPSVKDLNSDDGLYKADLPWAEIANSNAVEDSLELDNLQHSTLMSPGNGDISLIDIPKADLDLTESEMVSAADHSSCLVYPSIPTDEDVLNLNSSSVYQEELCNEEEYIPRFSDVDYIEPPMEELSPSPVLDETDSLSANSDDMIENSPTNGYNTRTDNLNLPKFIKCYTEKLSNRLLSKCVSMRRSTSCEDDPFLRKGEVNGEDCDQVLHRRNSSTADPWLNGSSHKHLRNGRYANCNQKEGSTLKDCRFEEQSDRGRLLSGMHGVSVSLRNENKVLCNHSVPTVRRNWPNKVGHRVNCMNSSSERTLVIGALHDSYYSDSYDVNSPSEQASVIHSVNNDVTQQPSLHLSRGCQTDCDFESQSFSTNSVNWNQSYHDSVETSNKVKRRISSNVKRINPLKCPKCRRVYKTEASFQRHIETCDFVIDSSSSSDDEDAEQLSSYESVSNEADKSYICEKETPMEAPEVSVGSIVSTPLAVEGPFVPPQPLPVTRLLVQPLPPSVRRPRGRPRKYPPKQPINRFNVASTSRLSAPNMNQPSLLGSPINYYGNLSSQPNFVFQPTTINNVLPDPVNVTSVTYLSNSNFTPSDKLTPVSCSYTVPGIQLNVISALPVSSVVQPTYCHTTTQVPMLDGTALYHYSPLPTGTLAVCSSAMSVNSTPDFLTQPVYSIVNDVVLQEPIQLISAQMPVQTAAVSHLTFPNVLCAEPYLSQNAQYFTPNNVAVSNEQPTLGLNYQFAVSQSGNYETFTINNDVNIPVESVCSESSMPVFNANAYFHPNSLVQPNTYGNMFQATNNLYEGDHPMSSGKLTPSTLTHDSVKEAENDDVSKRNISSQTVSSPPSAVVPHLAFEITSDDGFHIQSDNIDDAWKTVAEIVQNGRSAVRSRRLAVEGISGLRMMGVTHSAVRYCLEQLPGARQCKNVKFLYHEGKTPLELLYNPSGCARSEPYKKRRFGSFHRCVFRQQRMPGDGGDREGDELPSKIISRRSSNGGSLRANMKESIGVFRSNIHGLGLLCKRNIEAGEQVMEYAGEVIRSILADKREKYYESKGIGCYMFRIDDKEVVDATIHGNAARFINHSCEPNCYSKVITVDNKKHIGIFALRRIACGEELTYDYKFPIEDVKIPCTCGSRKCRRFLN